MIKFRYVKILKAKATKVNEKSIKSLYFLNDFMVLKQKLKFLEIYTYDFSERLTANCLA